MVCSQPQRPLIHENPQATEARRETVFHLAAAFALSNIAVTLSPFDIFFTSLL